MTGKTVHLTTNPETGRFAALLLDKYGAPCLSKLTACGAPELDEPKNFLGSFVLSSIFEVTFPDPFGRIVLIFGRRVDHAVREYRIGRELLLSYLQRLPQTNSHFLAAMRATTHFEHCIASACQAGALLKRLTELTDSKDPLAPKDDRDDRLRLIWNRAKHFEDDLGKRRLSDAAITAPVWLSNDGISSEKARVTFDELHSFLIDLLHSWKFLSEDLPKQVIARRQAENEGTEKP